MAILRHEVAPITEKEWAEALKGYGCDRDDVHAYPPTGPDTAMQKPNLFDPSLSVTSQQNRMDEESANMSYFSSRLLHHQESGDDFDELTSYFPGPKRQGSHHSASSHSSAHAGPSRNMTVPILPSHSRSARESFGSDSCASPMDIGVPDVKDTAALDIAYTINGPRARSCTPATDEETRSGDAERLKLREFYETEGWLPGPKPSKITSLRRKRAIRRLGLCCSQEEAVERRNVLAKYAELAQQMFQTATAFVSVVLDEKESIYSPTPGEPPQIIPVTMGMCGHAIIHNEMQCTVIADVSKDWRFRGNQPLQEKLAGAKFYASAPLRYRRNEVEVDVGTLCLLDADARNEFDSRERSILLNLANMLVYQLITLQTGIVAKKSSAMYENCISFLRRSVTSDETRLKQDAEKERKAHKEQEREHRREARRERLEARVMRKRDSGASPARPNRSTRADSSTSVATAKSPPKPPLAVKTGPRDSKAAKRDADLSDKALYTDAAKTCRRILQADAVAIVNIDEYQLFIRRSSGSEKDQRSRIQSETKEAIIGSFLQGRPWPADIDPVIHYVPKSQEPGVIVLGTDSASGPCDFHFNNRGTEKTLSDFLGTYLKTRHFWWDREDTEDDLSLRMMDLMPNAAQTMLGTAFMTNEGKTKFAMFASWNRPPAEFGDSHTIALPFAYILGGCTLAALALRKVRSLEMSQISYSNLQAHELRTPLHQILAITQLLRSSMNDLADTPHDTPTSSLTTTQQIRDLLPFLDAIDTSGKTLHGIVDNILSFLDLKGKDDMVSPTSPSLLNSPSGATQSIEVMFEELIHDACEEDKRSRTANGQPMYHTETVFEIIPPLLGEQVTEDAGGALRRAMSKILSNAYKFIEGEGCVQIYVDDVPNLLPPEGCEDLALTKRIKIIITDNGKGMDASFVREKLGEPWAKEDPYATGSGLSVHLAYRIIDLMGGHMEVTSGPGQGCKVELEVPVPRRTITMADSATKRPEEMQLGKKVTFVGFDSEGPGAYGRHALLEALQHQYRKLGCEIVDLESAELAIVDGRTEETEEGVNVIGTIKTDDIVFLVASEHEALPAVLTKEKQLGKTIRRFRKPATPSILRESLFPGHSKAIVAEIPDTKGGHEQHNISSPEQVTSHGRTASSSGGRETKEKPKLQFADQVAPSHPHGHVTPELIVDNAQTCPVVSRLASLWRPRNMDVEDAVASLSLGDYFSSRRRTSLMRANSNGGYPTPTTPTFTSSIDTDSTQAWTPQVGSEREYMTNSTMSDDGSYSHGHRRDKADGTDVSDRMDDTPGLEDEEDEEEEEEESDEVVKVMVVEDNMVNRKILVKILTSKLANESVKMPIEVLEAADGHAAVELFREISGPVIVLLDINMPKMDGYQACLEMRAIEKAMARQGSSQIIAVTALGGEAEKHRGIVECGMNQWYTKPCSKSTIHKIVDEARASLLSAKGKVRRVTEDLIHEVEVVVGRE